MSNEPFSWIANSRDGFQYRSGEHRFFEIAPLNLETVELLREDDRGLSSVVLNLVIPVGAVPKLAYGACASLSDTSKISVHAALIGYDGDEPQWWAVPLIGLPERLDHDPIDS